MEMKWIPVEERLPEVEPLDNCEGYKLPRNTIVLVTTKYGVSQARYTRLILRKKEVLRFEGPCGIISGVIAWMPMPEPYKKEGV